MMKKKKIIIFCIIFTLLISLYLINYYMNNNSMYMNNDSIYMLQVSGRNYNNVVNKFQYYNEDGKLLKTEQFSDIGDISYNTIYKNKIYSFGPGGLYETDSKNMKSIKLNDKDINIVKFYNEKMYFYVNGGYKEDYYDSQICSDKNCVQTNLAVVDFVVSDEYLYVLGLNSLSIFKKDSLIKKIDLSENIPYQKILELDNRFFVVNDNKILEIVKEDLLYIVDNDFIKDRNFINYNNIVADRISKNITIMSIKNNLLSKDKDYTYLNNARITYSLNEEEMLMYKYTINNNVELFSLDGSTLVKFKPNILDNDSVFMVYKIK